MTKADLIEAVYEELGVISKKEASEFVEIVFSMMKDTLARGDKIKISGFGNFVVRPKGERMVRNPRTGTPMMLAARKVLTFRPSPILKSVMNPRPSARNKKVERSIVPEDRATV